jgi:putative transposase
MMDQKLDYIHNNPVKEGIVDRPEEYVYSSARNYAGLQGLINVNFIE